MERFVQLGADIVSLWNRCGGDYLNGIKNTLILALVATILGCVIVLFVLLNTLPGIVAGLVTSASGGSGCICYIDPSQNVLSTSTVNVTLKVRPYGYARFINVELGFQVAAA